VRLALATCLSVGTALAGEQRVVMLDLQGLQCYACVQTVKKALQSVPGVQEAVMDLDKKTATVKFDSSKTDAQALIKATAQAGFPSKVR
jgi:mercuric ion binding protein